MKKRTILQTLLAVCLMLVACDDTSKKTEGCGNGLLDLGEACDGGELQGASCESLGYYFAAGVLHCSADCRYDVSECGGRCGDGVVDAAGPEQCDDMNLNGTSCQALGYGGGSLTCRENCMFDMSGCTSDCGNGVIERDEFCDDGNAFVGDGCSSACEVEAGWECEGTPSDCTTICGDDQVTGAEECDGGELAGQTCETLGYYGGTLTCSSSCDFVITGCEAVGRCGDGEIQATYGEECEGGNLDDQNCETLGYYGGVLACDADCHLDLTSCEVVGRCGDGTIQTAFGEACDMNALGGATCATEGFYEGTLTCGSNCQRVTTGCSGQCGDGIIQLEHGEDCEGSELGGQTCVSLGYTPRSGGPLACLTGCVFDESACVEKSSNADLATLTVSEGTLMPVFSGSIISYGVSLPYAVVSQTMTATAADAPYATVEISPAQPMALVEGVNPVTLTVTAENGTQKVYTIFVHRWGENYTSTNIGEILYVPAGTFQRNATATNLSMVSAFRMSKYEITRAQWVEVTGWADPSNIIYSSGTSDPVQMVSWYDAIAFCNKLSLLEGLTPVYTVSGVDFTTLTYAQIPTTDNTTWNAATANWAANGYRLPTEMEWMWAAMGADTANPGAVNTTGYTKAFAGSTGSNAIGDYSWYTANSGGQSHPVGTRLANELGFNDLSGNIYEWAWDWHAAFYPSGMLADFRGPASGTTRVFSGCHWGCIEYYCTVAYRLYGYPDLQSDGVGFRVVRN